MIAYHAYFVAAAYGLTVFAAVAMLAQAWVAMRTAERKADSQNVPDTGHTPTSSVSSPPATPAQESSI
jgi:hypothetical protein